MPKTMAVPASIAAVASLLSFEVATAFKITPRPTLLYSSVSPKLRIQTEEAAFNSAYQLTPTIYFLRLFVLTSAEIVRSQMSSRARLSSNSLRA